MTCTTRVRRLFALPSRKRPLRPIEPSLIVRALPRVGQITLLTGPSGGGKSRLLRAMQSVQDGRPLRWINPAALPLPNVSVIDCVCDALDDASDHHVEHALELLSRVGLAEAWTYLQKPAELSDGQRWRLMLALGVTEALKARDSAVIAVLAMDEFAALLDRVTARIVARALRRLVDRQIGEHGPVLGAVVATSHHDLLAALQPETIVTCDFDCYTVTGR